MKLVPIKLTCLSVSLACLSAAAFLAPQRVAAQSLIDGAWNMLLDEDAYQYVPGINGVGDERGDDPYAGDFAGFPITAAARDVAQAFDEAQLEIPEMQCRPYATPLGPRSIGTLQIWEDRDPRTLQQTQIEILLSLYDLHRHIWIGSNPNPQPGVEHTWAGYSTGKWVGNALWVHTDHLKAGILQRGSDLPLDDQTTMDERFFRDGDLLTDVMFISDSQYLSRPYVNSKQYIRAPQGSMTPLPCVPFDEISRPEGVVPLRVPGYTELEGAVRNNIPLKAEQGGAETEFPEYQETIKNSPPNPSVEQLHKATEKEQAEEDQYRRQR